MDITNLIYHTLFFYIPRYLTAVLKGKGDQSEEIAKFYMTYFNLDPLVLWLLFPVNHVCN